MNRRTSRPQVRGEEATLRARALRDLVLQLGTDAAEGELMRLMRLLFILQASVKHTEAKSRSPTKSCRHQRRVFSAGSKRTRTESANIRRCLRTVTQMRLHDGRTNELVILHGASYTLRESPYDMLRFLDSHATKTALTPRPPFRRRSAPSGGFALQRGAPRRFAHAPGGCFKPLHRVTIRTARSSASGREPKRSLHVRDHA